MALPNDLLHLVNGDEHVLQVSPLERRQRLHRHAVVECSALAQGAQLLAQAKPGDEAERLAERQRTFTAERARLRGGGEPLERGASERACLDRVQARQGHDGHDPALLQVDPTLLAAQRAEGAERRREADRSPREVGEEAGLAGRAAHDRVERLEGEAAGDPAEVEEVEGLHERCGLGVSRRSGGRCAPLVERVRPAGRHEAARARREARGHEALDDVRGEPGEVCAGLRRVLRVRERVVLVGDERLLEPPPEPCTHPRVRARRGAMRFVSARRRRRAASASLRRETRSVRGALASSPPHESDSTMAARSVA